MRAEGSSLVGLAVALLGAVAVLAPTPGVAESNEVVRASGNEIVVGAGSGDGITEGLYAAASAVAGQAVLVAQGGGGPACPGSSLRGSRQEGAR